ncbi:hypothetical protein BC938DRAFT_472990 [Jimgerdemannia flammicorona]|uniref:WD40-repeat-containing domain protein n=1 Tax=Jimgerdemannia flammicorona TaxID=994334 RepID=A0A433Q501_9FUNG|nr:hypothetical protein BC938DRAFT_472990 [Jimgerdemannia flammicorona]
MRNGTGKQPNFQNYQQQQQYYASQQQQQQYHHQNAESHSVILVTAGYDHTIRFWEALSGICSRTIQHPDSQVNRLCISPDKRYLAAAVQIQIQYLRPPCSARHFITFKLATIPSDECNCGDYFPCRSRRLGTTLEM